HGHATMMGVFGMLGIALTTFVLRQTASEESWLKIEPYIRVSFWGTNVGLMMMLVLSLFPGGVLQVWDVTQSGYWHARSLDYIGSPLARTLEWMRLPGDVVFIGFGVVPLVIATMKTWLGVLKIGSTGQKPEYLPRGGDHDAIQAQAVRVPVRR